MSLGHGPKVTTSGLILCLDAANPKSYIGLPNKTAADWVQTGTENWDTVTANSLTGSTVSASQNKIVRLDLGKTFDNITVNFELDAVSTDMNVYLRDAELGTVINQNNTTTGSKTVSGAGVRYIDFSIFQTDSATVTGITITSPDWFDLSGNGNHAVLTDAPTFSNGTLQFDGISQYATVDGGIRTQIDAGSASTIIAIANMKSIEHVDNLIGWGNANTALTWGLYSQSSVLRAGYQGATLGNAGAIGNQWVFLAARFDATDTYATVRGNLTDVDATVGKGVYDWHGIGTGNPVTICKTSYYARWMEADVSAIYVYDTFLTDTQLEQHYNALRGRFGI
jgi:hypothetical protein